MLGELQEAVFFSVANLLNLEVDILFFDTSSTYWETDSTDDALLREDTEEDAEPGDGAGRVVERAWRIHGHSKDHRPDLPQVVIGMAVTRDGIPVRVWTFPGNTSDQVLIRTVKDDLSDWNLNRVIWALDRGFTSAANRRYLQRGGGHYIMGEKLRGDSKEAAAALSRQGRYHTVAGNLRVKEVRVDNGTARDRFVICHNPDAAVRDAAVRDQIVARLAERIAGSDKLSAPKRTALAGQLHTKAAFARFLRTTAAKTASAPTSNSSGLPCSYSASLRPPWGTPGATSATNSNASTSSPSPPPTADSPNAANSPPANAPSCGPSNYPNHPGSSTSPPPTSNPHPPPVA